jgi:hypothetical protein
MQISWRKSAAKKGAPVRQQQASPTADRNHAAHAQAEIHAYISIRDRLLAEAEEVPTNSTLHRAWIANDVVQIFLKPARRPYEGQYLPEDEARVERERCETIKQRIGDLRGNIVTPTAGTIQKPGETGIFGVRARAH